MWLHETRINIGGAFRCCVESVLEASPDADYEPDETIPCRHCQYGMALSKEGTWRALKEPRPS